MNSRNSLVRFDEFAARSRSHLIQNLNLDLKRNFEVRTACYTCDFSIMGACKASCNFGFRPEPDAYQIDDIQQSSDTTYNLTFAQHCLISMATRLGE